MKQLLERVGSTRPLRMRRSTGLATIFLAKSPADGASVLEVLPPPVLLRNALTLLLKFAAADRYGGAITANLSSPQGR
jgi:hypothetical protein